MKSYYIFVFIGIFVSANIIGISSYADCGVFVLFNAKSVSDEISRCYDEYVKLLHDEDKNGFFRYLIDYLKTSPNVTPAASHRAQYVVREDVLCVLGKRKKEIEQIMAGLYYENVLLGSTSLLAVGLLMTHIHPIELKKEMNLFRQTRDFKSFSVSRTDLMSFGVLGVIAGFGLYAEIQAMRATKTQLTAELEKINKMLAVLEKVQ